MGSYRRYQRGRKPTTTNLDVKKSISVVYFFGFFSSHNLGFLKFNIKGKKARMVLDHPRKVQGLLIWGLRVINDGSRFNYEE